MLNCDEFNEQLVTVELLTSSQLQTVPGCNSVWNLVLHMVPEEHRWPFVSYDSLSNQGTFSSWQIGLILCAGQIYAAPERL